MANIRSYYGGDGSDPVKWFRGKVARIEDGVEGIIRENMDEGAKLMREMIETRGTGRTWKYPWNGRHGSYPGRDDTGHMKNSVSSNTTVSERGRVTGRFGWLGKREDYFGFQEGGFEHVEAGITVEGMYAMQDSADFILNQVKEDIRRTVRDA